MAPTTLIGYSAPDRDGNRLAVVESFKLAYVASEEAGLDRHARLVTEVRIDRYRRLLVFEVPAAKETAP